MKDTIVCLKVENDRLRGALSYCIGTKAGGPEDIVSLAMKESDAIRLNLEVAEKELVEANRRIERAVELIDKYKYLEGRLAICHKIKQILQGKESQNNGKIPSI